jgi:putative colanic acid biosynthesis acetyltransferase WcaF
MPFQPSAVPFPVDLRQSRTPWPFSYKMRRLRWELCRLLLFRPTPKWLGNPWRLWLLRRFGASIQEETLVLPSCRILHPWDLSLGYGSWLGEGVQVYNYAPVTIGPMTVVSQRSFLCTGAHDHTHPHFPLIWRPVTIGSQVWICAEAFVGPGVTIGDGAVIGARAVVTRDMPPWMICAGNPCRPLKPRTIKSPAEAGGGAGAGAFPQP